MFSIGIIKMCFSKPVYQNRGSYLTNKAASQYFNMKYNRNKRYIKTTSGRLQKTLNDTSRFIRRRRRKALIKIGIGKKKWKMFKLPNVYHKIDIVRAYRSHEPVRYRQYRRFMRPRR